MSAGGTAGLTSDLCDYITNLSLFSLKRGVFYVSVLFVLPNRPKRFNRLMYTAVKMTGKGQFRLVLPGKT